MQHDIVIIGAGPAGLSFARTMAPSGLRIVLLEKNKRETLTKPAYDGREIALTHLSHKLMNDLGMWQLIPQGRHFRIKDAKVVNGNSPYSLDFSHKDSGRENLGFMVSNSVIRKAAFESLAGFDNVTILDETEVVKVGTDSSGGWVELANGDSHQARLIIAADSRFSSTRRMMGISTSMLDFGRTCIVCTLSAEKSHEDTAIEYFHFDRTLAVLPLNDNQVSVVVTLKTSNADAVLGMSDQEFAADIEKRTQGKFGAFSLTSKLFSYPLVATYAQGFCKNRFAVIGDAAVGMHPVTAHGFNLGLQGADTLAREISAAIARGEDFASLPVLQRYNRAHTLASAPIYHGTNALVRLFTNTSPPARFARDALLHLGNAITPARNLIMDRLTEIKSIRQTD